MATAAQLFDQAENALGRARYALKQHNTPEVRDLVDEAETTFGRLRRAIGKRDWSGIALFSARVVDLACRASAVAQIKHPWYTQAICMGTAAGLGIHRRITESQNAQKRETMRQSVQRHRR
jgi:hypothetical protein